MIFSLLLPAVLNSQIPIPLPILLDVNLKSLYIFNYAAWSSSSGDFSASWVVTGNKINFTVTGNTLGWIGFGLHSTPYMIGSDTYTGWVTSGGVAKVIDGHAVAQLQPTVDTTNNVLSYSGFQTGSSTTFSFVRYLDTLDSNDVTITNSSIYLVYALGSTDPDGNNNYQQHYTTGSGSVNFLASAPTGGGSNHTSNGTASIEGPSFTAGGGNFKVTWKLNADNITFMIVAKTLGWVGLGFGQSGQMPNADMYVGWVNADGSANLYDSWATGTVIPEEDTTRGGTNDAHLVSAYESKGYTTIIFTRKLVTGDSNDREIKEGKMYVLWAIGTNDGTDGVYSEHSDKGSLQVNFYSGSVSPLEKFPPAILLIIVVVVILILAAIIHWIAVIVDRVGGNKPVTAEQSLKDLKGSNVQVELYDAE